MRSPTPPPRRIASFADHRAAAGAAPCTAGILHAVDSPQTTAYPFNTRATVPAAARPGASTVARLRAADHAIADAGFRDEEGVLYRGVVPLTAGMLAEGDLPFNGPVHSLCALDRDLDVLLVSNELSDAITVARPYVATRNAAVAVLPVSAFAWRADAQEAGVLSFAEPGVVFRYPFLARPVTFAECLCLIVHQAFLARLRVNRRFRDLAPFHANGVSLVASGAHLIPIIGIKGGTREAFTLEAERVLAAAGIGATHWR